MECFPPLIAAAGIGRLSIVGPRRSSRAPPSASSETIVPGLPQPATSGTAPGPSFVSCGGKRSR